MDKPKSITERFFAKVQKSPDPDGCWLWTGANNGKYGHFSLIKFKKPLLVCRLSSHRFSYAFHNGGIPKGMCVLHRCDTPLCVNPAHLFLGTKAENSQDMVRKGRNVSNWPKGAGHHKAKFTPEMIRDIRQSTLTRDELARQYGASVSTIGCILRYETWRHVD